MIVLKIFEVLCLILLYQFNSINGAAIISPFPIATVCSFGDRLQVTCLSTNERILYWEFMLRGTNSHIEREISSTTQVLEVVTAHSTVFFFSRTSELGTLPLESTLEISSVGQNLNGSTIICRDLPSAMVPMANTTVHIVGENDIYRPNPPEVSLEEQFGVNNVTVVLQWTEDLNNSLVTYHLSVEPMADYVITGNGRANLTVSYDTPYNVSVVAGVCGRINATTTLMVNYVNCGAPGLDESAGSVLVMPGNINVALEGDSVTFSCSSGLILIGPNMSICMENGEWEPDPREVVCKGGSNSHQSLNEVWKIAVASVSVFFVTFALAFTLGFLCGHCSCHRKQRQLAETSGSAEMKVTPLYEAITPTKQELEMNKNTAYSM